MVADDGREVGDSGVQGAQTSGLSAKSRGVFSKNRELLRKTCGVFGKGGPPAAESPDECVKRREHPGGKSGESVAGRDKN